MRYSVVALAVLLSAPVFAASHRQSSSDVYVEGHTRSNGTYVEPYYRSAPNAYKWDNYNYVPSQPAYNNSYYVPQVDYGSNWYIPNPGRLSDTNPYNDIAPTYNSNLSDELLVHSLLEDDSESDDE